MTVRIDRFDREVFAFNPSQLLQALAETIDVGMRCDGEPANARTFGLRARRERPCGRRAADKRDELAPFQSIELHSIPASQGRIAGYRISNGQSAGIRSRAGPELGRDDERRELAAGPWPRKVRGGIPRK